MKKIIAWILIAGCLFTLFSCKSNEKEEQVWGTISETAKNGSGVFWEEADASVLQSFDAEFEKKKKAAEAFYQIPPIMGTTYYISSINGSNSAKGTSAEAAWKSCSKLSTASLKAGDAVLFECGSEFRESVTLVSGVTYASYGTGKKPVFYGSIDASKSTQWKAVSGVSNLYQYSGSLSSDIGSIVFNGGEAWGIKIQELYEWVNGEMSWTVQKSLELHDVSNGIKTFEKIPSFVLKDGKDLGRNGKIDLAYFQDGVKLYLYCEGENPAERFSSIELSQHVQVFSGKNIKNVTVANINFFGGTFGIRTIVCDNLTVKNCGFEFIGGQIQLNYTNSARNYQTRLGNAIENWNECKGMTVENCYFNQIYDTAMTTQSNTDGTNMENIYYRNNVIENVVYAIELWSGEGNCQFNNIEVSGNICRKIGYGMTTQRPDKVSGFISAKGDTYVFSNASVTDNTIVGSIDWLLRTNHIKTDANTNGYTYDRNIYVNTLGNAIGLLSDLYPKFSTGLKEYAYDYKTIQKFCASGVEPNGKFYFTVSEDGSKMANIEKLNGTVERSPFYTYQSADGYSLPFRLLLPNGYDATKSYKLLTYFNYEYASGTDNVKNVNMANDLIANAYADGGYIVLVPQCPEDYWTGLDVKNGNYAVSDISETDTMKAVYGLIHDIALQYQTIGNYAIGVSSGGYAVADLIARHTDFIKASVVIAGAGDPSVSVGSTKVWILHGEVDEKIPASDAKELSDAWGAEYTEFSRELHDCWNKAFQQEDIIGWLNQQ